MRSPRRFLADWFLRELTSPRRRYRRFVFNDPRLLKETLQAGDVLLVDGDQRVSEAVKYLTQSSWSHSALFIGDAMLRRDTATRRDVERRFGREARYLIVEALVDRGVLVSPVIKYVDFNVRICRPIGLTPEDREKVLDYVIARIGHTYDRRNFLDLTRYLLPFHVIPPRLREDALHFGSGVATETICSTLIAEAFAQVRFPIVPQLVRQRARTPAGRLRELILGRPTRRAYSGLWRARHPTLCVPRDFDLSPYFEIVKFAPRELSAFDYRKLHWEEAATGGAGTIGSDGPGTLRRTD